VTASERKKLRFLLKRGDVEALSLGGPWNLPKPKREISRGNVVPAIERVAKAGAAHSSKAPS